MVDLRPLRKSQAVGRVSVLAGCRMVLLPLGLLALRVVSCDLCNRMFSLAITFSLLFSPGISGALGVNKCSSDCSSAAPLSFSQTFALCSLLPFCTDVLCMSLPTFLKSPLSQECNFLVCNHILNRLLCFSLGIVCLKLFYNEILRIIEIVRNCIYGCGKCSIRYKWIHLLLNRNACTNSTCIHLNKALFCLYIHED